MTLGLSFFSGVAAGVTFMGEIRSAMRPAKQSKLCEVIKFLFSVMPDLLLSCQTDQGLRIFRLIDLAALSSPMMCSLAGSHFMGRP